MADEKIDIYAAVINGSTVYVAADGSDAAIKKLAAEKMLCGSFTDLRHLAESEAKLVWKNYPRDKILIAEKEKRT